MKYFQVNVKLKNGFEYSYTCIGKMLESMKKSSQSHWTDTIEVVEITEEQYRGPYIFLETEKTTEKKVRAKKSDKPVEPVKVEQKITTTRKPRKPKGNLEDFL